MSAFVSDVDLASFDREVLETSKSVPVLVDFWAPWCGPCRVLGPILERLADDFGGQFRLAKVNSDENPQLSAQFSVRSIPAVKAFSNGRVVDEFVGALPESQVRAFIERVLPSEAELHRRTAAAHRAAGAADEALRLLERAAALEPNNDAIHADRAELLLELGRTDEAREVVTRLSLLADHDARVSRLLARLRFAETPDDRDEASLRARIEADPRDLDARMALARRLVGEHRYEGALEELMTIVRANRKWQDDAGRKTMLALFDLLGPDHELVSKYRRQLASALY